MSISYSRVILSRTYGVNNQAYLQEQTYNGSYMATYVRNNLTKEKINRHIDDVVEQSNATKFYIGITKNYENRFYTHDNFEKYGCQIMVVLFKVIKNINETQSDFNTLIKDIEMYSISHARKYYGEKVLNIGDGGEGVDVEGSCYVYILLKVNA